MSSILVEIKASSSEFMAKMGEARAEVGKLQTESSSHFKQLQAVGKAAFLGIAGGAVALAGASLELGDQLEASQTRLQGALANSGNSWDAYKGRVDLANAQMAKYGISSAQTESALATLTNATRNPTLALKDLGLAADIAKGRNISLEQATTLLSKVQTGHVTALTRLGLQTKDATGKTLDQQQAIALLARTYGGDASRSADTFGGRVQAMKAQLDNTAATIGIALIPVLERMTDDILSAVQWFERHRQVAIVLGVAIASVLVPAVLAYVAGLVATAAVQLAALAPLILLTAAVAAIGVGIYELATHWKTVWDWVKKITGDAWNWIKRTFDDGVGHIRPLITIVTDLIKIDVDMVRILASAFEVGWALIVAAVRAAWAVIGPIVRVYLKGSFDVLRVSLTVFRSIWSTTWSVITSVVKTAWSILNPILSTMASTLKTVTNAVSDVTGAVSKVSGGISGGLSKITGFHLGATGALVTQPTLALIGEAGPEMVVPMGSLDSAPGASPLGGSSGSALTVVSPIYLDGQLIATVVTKHQRQAARRGVPVAAG